MPIFVAMGVQFFEGDEASAKANAEYIKEQSESLAAQSTLVSPGLAKNMPSWFGSFEVNPVDGSLTLVSAWHLDEAGVVQVGLPDGTVPGDATPST